METMRILPHKPLLTDGLLDVTILEPFTVLDVPSLALSSSSTRPLTRTAGSRRSAARQSRIHRSKPGVVHFDGDPMDDGMRM